VDGTADDLRGLLDRYGDVPTQRIVAALLVERGVPEATVAAALGVSTRTVYNWLERFESRPLAEAPFDEPRPGAPAELGPAERAALFETLAGPPPAPGGGDGDEVVGAGEGGGGEGGWTPDRVQALVRERYGVDYSRRHVRRLMHAAGLVYRRGSWTLDG